jgi:drug/metabolite transporter (DMT)-like permease
VSVKSASIRLTPAVAYVMLVVVMALWAGGVVIARSVAELVPPIGFSFWRWCAASILLTPVIAPRLLREWPAIRRRLRYFALLGLFMAGASTLLIWAIQYTTATNVVLVAATQPIATAIAAWILLKERLTRAQAAGVAAALGGIVAMVVRLDLNVILELSFNPGDVLVVVAVVFYALYSVNLHKWIAGVSPLMTMYMTCIGGTAIIAPFYLAESVLLEAVPLDVRVVGAILFMAAVPTLIATTMWNVSVGEVGANRASVFINLLPVFGTLLAVVFLGERLHSYHLVGGALVCAGITMVVRTMNPDELEMRESARSTLPRTGEFVSPASGLPRTRQEGPRSFKRTWVSGASALSPRWGSSLRPRRRSRRPYARPGPDPCGGVIVPPGPSACRRRSRR